MDGKCRGWWREKGQRGQRGKGVSGVGRFYDTCTRRQTRIAKLSAVFPQTPPYIILYIIRILLTCTSFAAWQIRILSNHYRCCTFTTQIRLRLRKLVSFNKHSLFDHCIAYASSLFSHRATTPFPIRGALLNLFPPPTTTHSHPLPLADFLYSEQCCCLGYYFPFCSPFLCHTSRQHSFPSVLPRLSSACSLYPELAPARMHSPLSLWSPHSSSSHRRLRFPTWYQEVRHLGDLFRACMPPSPLFCRYLVYLCESPLSIAAISPPRLSLEMWSSPPQTHPPPLEITAVH